MRNFKEILEGTVTVGLDNITSGAPTEIKALGAFVQDMMHQEKMPQSDKNTVKKFFIKLVSGNVSVPSKDAKTIIKVMKKFVAMFGDSGDVDEARNIIKELKSG